MLSVSTVMLMLLSRVARSYTMVPAVLLNLPRQTDKPAM